MNSTTRNSLFVALSLIASACGADIEGEPWDTGSAEVDAEVRRALARGEIVSVVVQFDTTARAAEQGSTLRRLPYLSTTVGDQAGLEMLTTAPGAVHVHYDVKLHPTGLADGLALVGQPVAQERGRRGDGKTIAVLDTGVDYTQDAFGNCGRAGEPGCRVVHAQDFAPEDGQLDGRIPHGTNVAAIAAAVAPGAQIAALDVFDGDSASSSDIIAAIDWAIANRDVHDIVAINMSLGTPNRFAGACDNHLFATPVREATQAGIAVVTSSGNDADAQQISAPGCVSKALTVGAVYSTQLGFVQYQDCSDTTVGPDDVTCFSNASPQLDLLAPGSRVDAGGTIMTGTSQASPHVAGAVAIIAGMQPGTPEDWSASLIGTGSQVVDPRNGWTFPRLDLDAATVPEPQPEPTEPEPTEPEPTEPEPTEPEPTEPEPTEPEPTEPEPTEPEPTEPEQPEEPAPVPGDPHVEIDGGADTTDSHRVTLTLTAPHPSVMCVSNTTSCSDWVEFESTYEWTLEPGAGEKSVYVWFPDPDQTFRTPLVSDTIVVTD